MMKRKLTLLVLAFLTAAIIAAPARVDTQARQTGDRLRVVSDPYSMVAAVNDLRASYGLPPYEASGILMSVAQAHADYMAAAGSVTHYSADGSRPFQRSLAAGYPLAGDLSLGGFHAENIIAGSNMSVYEAVNAWMGDAPHQNTMLSPNLTQIGAGVAVVGDKIYYVIDAARPTGATSAVVVTSVAGSNGAVTGETGPVSGVGPFIATTIMPSTPLPDGKITHQVRGGETLWLIAITYSTKIDILRALNGLGADNAIYPGQVLVIQPGGSVTPAPSPTPNPEGTEAAPVATRVPTLAAAPALAAPTDTPEPEPMTGAAPMPVTRLAGIAILVAALVLALVLALSFRKP